VQTVRSIWYRLVGCALRSVNSSAGSNAEVHALERFLVPTNAILPLPQGVPVDSVSPARMPTSHIAPDHCSGEAHEVRELAPLNLPLFIATDIEDAPALAPLRAAFPCTFLLRDLADVPEVRKLNHLVSGEDGVRLAPFLEPLLDATIASRAWAVVGTEGSTFSRYVEDFLWQWEHGRQILERG
jgi:hypothetical protein